MTFHLVVCEPSVSFLLTPNDVFNSNLLKMYLGSHTQTYIFIYSYFYFFFQVFHHAQLLTKPNPTCYQPHAGSFVFLGARCGHLLSHEPANCGISTDKCHPGWVRQGSILGEGAERFPGPVHTGSRCYPRD